MANPTEPWPVLAQTGQRSYSASDSVVGSSFSDRARAWSTEDPRFIPSHLQVKDSWVEGGIKPLVFLWRPYWF